MFPVCNQGELMVVSTRLQHVVLAALDLLHTDLSMKVLLLPSTRYSHFFFFSLESYSQVFSIDIYCFCSALGLDLVAYHSAWRVS
jgi:hypothetical protein